MKKNTSITLIIITVLICLTIIVIVLIQENGNQQYINSADNTIATNTESQSEQVIMDNSPTLTVSYSENMAYYDFICEVNMSYDCELFSVNKQKQEIKLASYSEATKEAVDNPSKQAFRWHYTNEQLHDVFSVYAREVDEKGNVVSESTKNEIAR